MLHLILVGILYILILSVKNRGCGEGVGILLHGQNLLSVTLVDKLFVDSHLPTSEGWKPWLCSTRRGSGKMRSTGNRTWVAHMVAQWFTHYATVIGKRTVNERYLETWGYFNCSWFLRKPFVSVLGNCLCLRNFRFWSNIVCRHLNLQDQDKFKVQFTITA